MSSSLQGASSESTELIRHISGGNSRFFQEAENPSIFVDELPDSPNGKILTRMLSSMEKISGSTGVRGTMPKKIGRATGKGTAGVIRRAGGYGSGPRRRGPGGVADSTVPTQATMNKTMNPP